MHEDDNGLRRIGFVSLLLAGGGGRPRGPAPGDHVVGMTAAPSDDEWEELRRVQFPGARINLNPGTLGTPSTGTTPG